MIVAGDNQAVAARETQVDATMWQVPALSLTGQAFLMTIALQPDASRTARILSASLAVVVSILSMQLMARLRRLNVVYAEWLNDFETKNFGRSLHGPEFREILSTVRYGGPLGRIRSFHFWMLGLSAFGMAGILELCLAVWFPLILKV
jgi:hypothetical protein